MNERLIKIIVQCLTFKPEKKKVCQIGQFSVDTAIITLPRLSQQCLFTRL